VGAVLVIGIPVGLGLAALSSSVGDIRLTSPTPDGPDGPAGPDGDGPREEVEVVVPDLDGLEGTDAELGAILVDVNRSEDQMLATQERFAEVFAGAAGSGPADDIDALLAEVSDAAGDGQRELQDIRRDLTSAPVSDAGVRDLRDTYLSHLDAWVRYFVAIEAEPTLLAGGGDGAFTLAIDTTGDAFARAVREDLPEDLDERVRTFAEQIVARGFPERSLSDDDTV
jgi:hypothetical protein